jgi:branched-chain amino acid transport system ATP-binding protein
LSGGEAQMLAIARVLRMGSSVLLCDEPTEGLAPTIVSEIGQLFRRVKQQGASILLVEQNLEFATSVADRHYLISSGRIEREMSNSETKSREQELLDYLGV